MTCIRNNRGDMTLECRTTKAIIRENYEQLHYQKIDNIDKMDKFSQRCDLSKLIPKDTECLNTLISLKEIESVPKNLLTTETPGTVGPTGAFYKIVQEEIAPNL